jgi:hypothetical protein
MLRLRLSPQRFDPFPQVHAVVLLISIQPG